MTYLSRLLKMGSKMAVIARHEFSKTVRRKGFLFGTFGLPILLMLIFGIAFSQMPGLIGDTEQQDTGFVDYAGILTAGDGYISYPDESSAEAAVGKGEINDFFVLLADYPDTGVVTVYTTKSPVAGIDYSDIGVFIRSSIVNNAGLPYSTSERIIDPVEKTEIIELDDEGNVAENEPPGAFLIPMVLAFMLVFSIITSSGYLMQGIGEEKENRSGEMLLSSVSADQLLRGKIFGYGAVGLLQMGVWIAMVVSVLLLSPFSGLISGVGISWIIIPVLVYFILGYFLYSISIACTAAISTTTAEAQQASMIFTMFAIIPVAFFEFIVSAPDSPVLMVLTYFPYTAPFITIFRLSTGDVSYPEIAASLAILLISIYVAAKLSARVFRMGMLLTGKRAGLADVIKFLKG